MQLAVSPSGHGSTSPSTTAFYNDTSLVSISASAGSGYVFDYWSASSGSITFGSVSSPSTTATIGAAGTITANLRQYVQPVNNPSDLVNLTGSDPSVYVSLFNQTYNDLAAGSCSGPPCTPSLEGYSFQFNAVFPNFRVANNTSPYDYCGTISNTTTGCVPFMMQAVIEFHADGTCTAKPQGAPSFPPAPNDTTFASFPCSYITTPGTNFEWILTNSSGYFTSIELKVNGTSVDTWNASSIFDVTHWPSDVDMTWAYAQSVFTGPDDSASYANFYAGGGFVTYSGAEAITGRYSGLKVTSEYSNIQYTTIPASVRLSNQTYDAGAFLSSYIGDSGSVTNPSGIVGPPSGGYAQLEATTSGATACVEGAFDVGRPPVNGTIAIYGYTYSVSSNVTVYVSSSEGSCSTGSWTKLYESMWTAPSAQWLPMGSVTNAEYVKIVAADAGSGTGGANIYLDSVSAFIGSYAQSIASYSASGVSNPSHMLQIPGSGYGNLQALSSGSSAWINASLGTEYSGNLVLYLEAEAGYTSSQVTVQYSSTGANGSWVDACYGLVTVTWTSELAVFLQRR